MSLARGPVLFTGTVLFPFGLLGLLVNADLPRDQFADGTVGGESWLGIEVNGWTNFFALAGGGLLLFAAGWHTLARAAALIVGGAAAACAVISLIDGEDVLGLAAADWATSLGFGVVAGVLLIAALLPRREAATQPDVVAAPEPETAVAEPEPERVRVEQSTPLTKARPATTAVRRRRPGLRARMRQLTRR